MQLVRTIDIGSITHTPSTTQTLRLPRGPFYRALHLHISGTVTGSTASQAEVKRGDELGLASKIQLIRNGTDVLLDITGAELKAWQKIWFGDVVAASVSLSTNDYVFDTSYQIPLADPTLKRPFDSILKSHDTSELRLDIQWGALTDMASDASTASVTCRVAATCNYGLDPNMATAVRRILRQVESITSGATQTFTLPQGQIYRGIFIVEKTSSGNGLEAQCVASYRLLSGGQVLLSGTHEQLRYMGARNLRLANIETAIGYGTTYWGAADGFVYIDLAPDGMLAEGIDSAGLSDLRLETVGSAAGSIVIMPHLFSLPGRA